MGGVQKSPGDSAGKILTAARAEFAEYGFAGARVDRIAQRSGVNKAMIYYHFRSKEKLYQEIIDRHLERAGQFIESHISDFIDIEDFLYQLAVLYDSMFETLDDIRPIFLRELASGGERIKAAFDKFIAGRGLIKKLKAVIERGRKAGDFRQVDSRQAIISFIGMNIFYLLMAPVLNPVWEIKDEKKFRKKRRKEVVDLFLHGLKAE
jgi:AcrR family transcriptional regulator